MSISGLRRTALCRLLTSSVLLLGAGVLPAHATTWAATAGKPFTPDASLGALPVSAVKPMHILVSLKRQNQDLLDSTYRNLFTPGNPQYHQFLTVDQRINLFSPSEAQVDRVTAYLQAQGFSNITVSKGRTLVQADGTASMASKAFNTSFVRFKQGNEEVFANTAVAQVPSGLGDIVLAINGLQNAWRMRTGLELARQRRASHLGPLASTTASAIVETVRRAQAQSSGMKTPANRSTRLPSTRAAKACGPVMAMPLSDVSVVSGFPPTAWDIAYDAGCTADGSGSTIAISTYGDDLTQVVADLRKMETANGYSYVPVEVRITTAITAPDTSGDDEWDLDSQSSTAIAGNVKKLILYTVDTSTDLVSEYTAFADNADAIAGNMSYGSCDAINSVTSNPTVGLLPAATASDPEFQAATLVGLSWFASTGDDGGSCSPVNAAGAPDAGVPGGANYPATSPYVTAVGGSSLLTDANYNYVQETAWTSGGGGISAIEQAPAWQTSSGAVPSALVGGAESLKGVPDISMNAGIYVPEAVVESGAQTVVNGADENVVGTSLSSPLATGAWARFQASHCQKLAFAAEVYYSLDTTTGPLSTATGFNDITLGSNGTYEATTGWDYTTGFGTIDLTNVDTALDVSAKRCTPVSSIPTAVLTSAQTSGTTTSGTAPFEVDFSGAGSSDSTGLSIDYYSIDFGDGSPIVVQAAAPPASMPKDTVGGTAASTTTYGPAIAHTYTGPGTYTATLTVRNSAGIASVNTAQLIITVGGTPLACTSGGELVVPAGAAAGTEGEDLFMGADQLEGTYFSEPASGKGQLYITMDIQDLSTVYPGLRWVTYFDVNGDTTNNYYVSMDTSTGTPSYTYGLHTLVPVAGDSEYTVSGTLDALSTDNSAAPGTITLVLDLSSIPLKVGDTLTSISSAVRTTAPDDPTGTLPIPGGEGLTQDSSGALVNYTIVGNSACAAATTGGGTTGTSTGSSTGGTSTGGTSTGTSTGGTSSGTSTGGTSSGGTSTGTSTGGATTGGSSTGSTSGGTSTGGTSTSGTSTGTSTGGTSSGGTSSGTSTGGTSSGGTSTGNSTGTSSGGTSTSGTSTGGTSTGTSTGGTSSGGTSSGTSTGGSSTGGTSTGTSSGGSGSGGTSTGTSSGGTSTGGSNTGTGSGGATTGGGSTGSSSTGSTSSGTVTVTAPGSNGTSGSFGLGLIPLAGLATLRRRRRARPAEDASRSELG